jgi:diacylglycerol kinase family enzyme
VGAGRAALGRAGAAVAATVVPGKPVPAARHPVLLVNPKAGEGKPEKLGLQDLAHERGIETIAVEAGAFEDAGRRAIASGADAIGVAGGDGSQAPVAALAAEHDVAFVCVPAGTLNHFALDLGLDRDDPVGALDAFGDAVERRIDLARIGDRVFCNNASLGMFAKIVRSKDYRERKLQTVAKMLPALLDEGGAEVNLRVTGPEDPEEEPANLVLVSNNPYELRGLGAVGTRERLDTGRLGVVALRVTNAAQIAELGALELAGRVEQFPGWREWSAEEVEVRSDDPVDASIDGEPVELESPLRFSIMPKALRVRVPRAHPGVSPAAARRRLGRFTVSRLARLALRGGPEMTTTSTPVESGHR